MRSVFLRGRREDRKRYCRGIVLLIMNLTYLYCRW